MRLGISPPKPTHEERELALCTFKPSIHGSPRRARPSSAREASSRTAVRPTLSSEEQELAMHCTFMPKVSSPPRRRAPTTVATSELSEAIMRRRGLSISVKDLRELRQLKQPPDLVRRVIEMVLILLQEDVGSWHDTLRHLADPYALLTAVATLRKASVAEETRELLHPYLSAPDMTVDHALRAASCLGALVDWVLHMARAEPSPHEVTPPDSPPSTPPPSPNKIWSGWMTPDQDEPPVPVPEAQAQAPGTTPWEGDQDKEEWTAEPPLPWRVAIRRDRREAFDRHDSRRLSSLSSEERELATHCTFHPKITSTRTGKITGSRSLQAMPPSRSALTTRVPPPGWTARAVLGVFSAPSYVSIGAPYDPKKPGILRARQARATLARKAPPGGKAKGGAGPGGMPQEVETHVVPYDAEEEWVLVDAAVDDNGAEGDSALPETKGVGPWPVYLT